MFLQQMKEREILTSIEITQCWKWSPVKWGGAPGEHGENSNEHRHQPLANHDPNNHANLVPKLPPHPARMKAKPTRPRDSLHPKPPIPQNRPRLAVMPQNARGNPCIPNHQSTKSKPCLLAAPATSRTTLPPQSALLVNFPGLDTQRDLAPNLLKSE